MAPIVTRERTPTLRFVEASVAVHVLLDEAAPPATATAAATYHQREFLSYAYREAAPLITEQLKAPDGLGTVQCSFPEVRYGADEQNAVLRAAPARYDLSVEVYRTWFRDSGYSVLSILLHRAEAAPFLTEFDVICLMKTWEPSEGASPPVLDDRKQLTGCDWARLNSPEGELTVAALVDRIRRSTCPRSAVLSQRRTGSGERAHAYLTGSLQLRVDAPSMRRLVADLADLGRPARRQADLRELQALSGVLRGLLAFGDAPVTELPSIFGETIAESRLITAVHKGTFLRVAAHMRMPSIYFLLPQAMALNNEALLRTAVDEGTALLHRVQDTAAARRAASVGPPESRPAARRVRRSRRDPLPDAARPVPAGIGLTRARRARAGGRSARRQPPG